MTAPLFHVERGSLQDLAPGAQVSVGGAEARHAVSVRRIAPGEQVIVADGAGQAVLGTVESADAAELVVRVEARRDEPQPSPRLVLVQALAKGGRDEDAVEAATELGVDEVVPWECERAIVRWRGPKVAKSHQKWVNVVTAAAKQSRRARTPEVAQPVSTRQLLARVEQGAVTLVLHEDATTPLAAVELPTDGDVLLLVGPEGGISPVEVDQLVAAGATPVRLGRGVLRASTAGPAAIAVLSARSRWR